MTRTIVGTPGPDEPEDGASITPIQPTPNPFRERLPRRRRSVTFDFRVSDAHGYVIIGEYDDGRIGEIFLKISKQGSTLAGMVDALAISISLGLQHGVPLSVYVQKYVNLRFEPAGMTDDPQIRIVSSILDYIFRRLAIDYLSYDERADLGILTTSERMTPAPITRNPWLPAPVAEPVTPNSRTLRDAPYCYQCGCLMQRAGSCYVCTSCGTTSGCS